VAFEESLSDDIFQDLPNGGTRPFVCGYLASLIDPGSIKHFGLVWPFLPEYPTALLWYGLCASLRSKHEILRSFKGLGRRLIRDLLLPDNLVGRPLADICLDELEVRLRGEHPLMDFHRTYSRNVVVELAPRVSTIIKLTERNSVQQMSLPEQFGSQEEMPLREELLSKVETAIRTLHDVTSKLTVGIQAERKGKTRKSGYRGKKRSRKPSSK